MTSDPSPLPLVNADPLPPPALDHSTSAITTTFVDAPPNVDPIVVQQSQTVAVVAIGAPIVAGAPIVVVAPIAPPPIGVGGHNNSKEISVLLSNKRQKTGIRTTNHSLLQSYITASAALNVPIRTICHATVSAEFDEDALNNEVKPPPTKKATKAAAAAAAAATAQATGASSSGSGGSGSGGSGSGGSGSGGSGSGGDSGKKASKKKSAVPIASKLTVTNDFTDNIDKLLLDNSTLIKDMRANLGMADAASFEANLGIMEQFNKMTRQVVTELDRMKGVSMPKFPLTVDMSLWSQEREEREAGDSLKETGAGAVEGRKFMPGMKWGGKALEEEKA